MRCMVIEPGSCPYQVKNLMRQSRWRVLGMQNSILYICSDEHDRNHCGFMRCALARCYAGRDCLVRWGRGHRLWQCFWARCRQGHRRRSKRTCSEQSKGNGQKGEEVRNEPYAASVTAVRQGRWVELVQTHDEKACALFFFFQECYCTIRTHFECNT